MWGVANASDRITDESGGHHQQAADKLQPPAKLNQSHHQPHASAPLTQVLCIHDKTTALITMNSKSLRRLAGDHGSLHTAGLPPNYLFPPNSDPSADLTSLDVLLAGPVGTPYAQGVWRLHLDIPPTYPVSAPTAFFRTRCWHPNVDEATGAVCVETLKRDWSSTLKLRDVLVTISCLLIQPNPASALNEEAGKLANEDWAGFERRARLMTEIHAAVPRDLVEGVREAQMRGEEKEKEMQDAGAGGGREASTAKARGLGKGKCKVEEPGSLASAKAPSRAPLVEDEENTRHRGRTREASTDDEADWIPGPAAPAAPRRSPRKATGPKRETNIFGIRGLEPSVSLEDASKRGYPIDPQTGGLIAPELESTDPFKTVTSKRPTQSQTSSTFVVPISPSFTASTPQHTAPSTSATDTPELLKYAHKNPFSSIQPNNQQHPLHKEFSFKWTDAEALFETGLRQKTSSNTEDTESRDSVRKRLAGEDFERRREWEAKRFKKAGWDLKRYNRGDFGPRVGIGRL
ncbi:hypothetical protein E8E13_004243 [Curvularia kusanoi]|uniref:UBC core domain-containing protein n=1 Tax=Curvularia kusanoi TaxID=90978 RepID=A0A9P4TIQ4_CURKU|nr:hypothetical protein E8E13_004243 [Curvularia kusanoi]